MTTNQRNGEIQEGIDIRKTDVLPLGSFRYRRRTEQDVSNYDCQQLSRAALNSMVLTAIDIIYVFGAITGSVTIINEFF